MRYQSNDLMIGVVEVIAYGTAINDGSRTPAAGGFNPPTRAAGASSGGEGITITNTACSTTNVLSGQTHPRALGVVRGITVRSRNVVTNLGAGLKANFIGGEIHSWTTLCENTRTEAFERMLKEASEKNASGVVAVRYETNEICPGITEVLAYGTAVA